MENQLNQKMELKWKLGGYGDLRNVVELPLIKVYSG